MDVAEPVCGYRYVLRYLYVAVDLGPLAVPAGPRTGSDIIGESLPYISGGHEAASGLHAWVCGAVQVVKNLSAEVPWYQGLERVRSGVNNEV